MAGETIGGVAIPDWAPRSVVKEARPVFEWAVRQHGGVENDFARMIVRLVTDERLRPAWTRLRESLEHTGRDPENVATCLAALFKGIRLARVHRVYTRTELRELFRDQWSEAQRSRERAEGFEAVGLSSWAEPYRDAERIAIEMAGVFLERDGDIFIVERHRTDPDIRNFVIALWHQTTGFLGEPLADVIALFANSVFDLYGRKAITARRVTDLTSRLKQGRARP